MKITLETNIETISEFYLQTLVLLYRPCEVFGKNDTSSSSLFVRAYQENGEIHAYVELSDNGKSFSASQSDLGNENYPDGINIAKTVVGRAFCECAKEVYGFTSPFGIITGIRPAKLALSYLERGYTPREIEDIFGKVYLIEQDKSQTLIDIASKERGLLHSLPKKSFSLYISVPFCPTRCSYCSFVSYSTERLLSMIPEYFMRLLSELENIGNLVRELGLELYSVYVGGGTPSILSAEQIRALFECVYKNFDMSTCCEITFEAGRPDTVTREKLEALKSAGVGRISINTQSANDDVLRVVGRKHTFSDYIEKLCLAKEVGFDSINTDLIAGLPTESISSFRNSVEKVIGAGAQNITVHSLTLKKSSELKTSKEYELLSEGKKVRVMLDFASDALKKANYVPYYIYRQKNTVGNLENTGYSLSGKECLYNIVMMEEFHSVFSAGAGAVTKLVSPDRKNIERFFNHKYPYEYLERTEKALDTDAVRKFYENNF